MNKKGITLVEIIISIALISIVLIFLFRLLVTVNDINKDSEVNTTYLINKALILKNIEEDLNNHDSITLSDCTANDIYSNYDTSVSTLGDNYKKNICLKINYGSTSAYLGVYYYDKRSSYVISYIHDKVRATRLLDNFMANQKNLDNLKFIYNYVKHDNTLESSDSINKISNITNISSDKNFFTIKIPIIGPDGKDYSIIISYYGIVNIT